MRLPFQWRATLWLLVAVLSRDLHQSTGTHVGGSHDNGGDKPPLPRLLSEKVHHDNHHPSAVERHEVGIIAHFIDQTRAKNRRYAKHWASSRLIASQVLELPSWSCYAVSVVLAVAADDSTAYRLKRTEHEKLAAMCDRQPHDPDSDLIRNISRRVIMNRHHNGLGNQIFQYTFSRLMAESLEIPWSSSLIRPDLGESPRGEAAIPPNSHQGWDLFHRVFTNTTAFASSGSGSRDDQDSVAKFVEGVCRSPNDTVIISDRPADLRLYGSLANQLVNAFFETDKHKPCLKFLGYFQEGLFYLPVRSKLLQWLAVPSPLPTPLPRGLGQESTIVLHVRSCGCCKWHWLSFTFYDTILSHLRTKDGKASPIFVVAPASCHASSLVTSIKTKYAAQVIDSKPGIGGMIQDFLFMMHAPRLVLGKSTFGFWAGYLSRNAREIHLPIEMKNNKNEKIPVMYNDNRFTYHGARGDWFGSFQSNSIRYQFHTKVEVAADTDKKTSVADSNSGRNASAALG